MDAMDRPTPGGSARPVRAPIFPVAPLNPIRLVSHLMGRGRSTAAGVRGEPRTLPVNGPRGVPEPSLGACVPSDEREQKSASTGAHRGPATGRRSLHRDRESFPLPELSHHDELPATRGRPPHAHANLVRRGKTAPRGGPGANRRPPAPPSTGWGVPGGGPARRAAKK